MSKDMNVKFIRADELSADKDTYEAIESAYRRGYHQGFYACLTSDVKDKGKLCDKIYMWRNRKKKGYLPPTK